MSDLFKIISAFNTTADSSSVYAINTTEFGRASDRLLRITLADSNADTYVLFGSSTAAPTSTAGTLCLGGFTEVFAIGTATYVALKSSTADMVANIALGVPV